MTEVSIIVLAIAAIITGFNMCKQTFRLNRLEDLVDSHWSAAQHECSAIWGVINGEEDEGDE